MLKNVSFVLFILSFLACNSQEKTNTNNTANPIQAKVDSLYTAENLPGIFVGVLDKGKRNYYGAGFADPDKKMSFDSATLFEIGSITKTFTAYVLVSVLNEKKISDTSSILTYLPDSVQQNKKLASISFLSLMNHTSGLPRLPQNLNLNKNPMAPYDDYTSGDLFAYLKTCSPQPDGKSNYSNLGAGLAGVLAERISGKTYAELLDQYIFLPFKIVTPDKSIAKSDNKSQGYFMDGNKSDYWNMNVLVAAGGLKCSASEMLTYLQTMSVPTNEDAKKIIDQLLAPTVKISPVMKVGRGWHIAAKENNKAVYWHNGGTYGFSTFGAFYPGEDKAVIVVVNQFNKNAVSDQLGMWLIKQLAD